MASMTAPAPTIFRSGSPSPDRVPVKRSAIRVDHDKNFTMLPMIVIAPHGTGKNRRDMHVPNRTDKFETLGRGGRNCCREYRRYRGVCRFVSVVRCPLKLANLQIHPSARQFPAPKPYRACTDGSILFVHGARARRSTNNSTGRNTSPIPRANIMTIVDDDAWGSRIVVVGL